jgi:hypothetical protein
MQLLCQLDTSDFPGWKRDFDSEATERMEAGLTLLQMWRDADSRSRVLMLFEANDRPARKDGSARSRASAAP